MSHGHLERLDSAIRSTKRGADREIKLELRRLFAELVGRRQSDSTESKDFFLHAFRVLTRIRGGANAETRLECLNEIVQHFYVCDVRSDALIAASALNQLAEVVNNKKWLRVAASQLGIVHADLGNVPDAVAHYSRALSIARELRDLNGQVITWINLGTALNYAGLYREAIPCFEQGYSLSHGVENLERHRPYALANRAQSHLFLGELQEGFEWISSALKISKEPRNPAEAVARTIRESTFVQLALELGKVQEAAEHATTCQTFAEKFGGKKSLFEAAVAKGLCEIHCGDVDTGLALLHKAHEQATDFSPQQIDILRILVNAYDQAGQPRIALDNLRLLMERLKGMRERSVGALLALSPQGWDDLRCSEQDFQALRMKELSLRAKSAESELFTTQIETLERLAVTAELKDEASGQHGYRVGKLSSLFAKKMGWKVEDCIVLEGAARLHDVGKISVPDRILFSSEELKEAQRHFLYVHATVGAELLSMSPNPHLRVAEEVARYHHEWFNGQGYPNKLSGKRIPIHAQIVSLADVFDALTHGRPYAEPWPIDRALSDISGRAGSQFDPKLVEVFVPLVQELCAKHRNIDEYLGKGSFATPFAQARNRIRVLVAAERERESRELEYSPATT